MKCKRCGGSGVEQDNVKIGMVRRLRRQSAQMSLRELSSIIGISHAFLSQLENGKRRWTQALSDKYLAAIEDKDK